MCNITHSVEFVLRYGNLRCFCREATFFSQIYAVLSWGKFCRKFTHYWGENFPGLKCGCGKKWLIWGMTRSRLHGSNEQRDWLHQGCPCFAFPCLALPFFALLCLSLPCFAFPYLALPFFGLQLCNAMQCICVISAHIWSKVTGRVRLVPQLCYIYVTANMDNQLV